MDANTHSALNELRSRLREAASLLGAHALSPSAPGRADAPWAQVLAEVDSLLAQSGPLVKSLHRESVIWDELDHLLGRIVLRDIAEVSKQLRALLMEVEAQLIRIDSQVGPLVAAVERAPRSSERGALPTKPHDLQ